MAIVDSKCDKNMMMDLWDNIHSLTNRISRPWILGGDSNTVLNDVEKIGRIPVFAAYIKYFKNYVKAYDVL